MNRHLVLVPGFGGFDALGTLRYYEGVTDVLERTSLVLHYFPNQPTASVRTRAEYLLSFLDERWRRKELRPGDEIHLVGHSTGGLDLRQLLLLYRELEQAPGNRLQGTTLEVLRHIRSVQFLSTPQRGTNLVRQMNQPLVRTLLIRPLLRVFYESVRGLREPGTMASGWLLRQVLFRGRRLEEDNWIDALIDTLQGCYSREGGYASARARSAYFELLRWLVHMANDSSALSDLNPYHLGDAPPSPAHEDDPEGERRFLIEHGIRFASIVTVARPKPGRWLDLFNRLHALTAESPVPRLGQAQAVQMLVDPTSARMLVPADNDGLVNTVSQVWPDAISSYLVEADHADVIGHFQAHAGGTFKQYDLLNSSSGFDAPAFTSLWKRIASFAEGYAYHETARHPPLASVTSRPGEARS